MTHSIKLSQRLLEVASYLPQGAKFADIGSDHAYLPCYICLQDSDARAIAGEVNEGPYQSAVNTVKEYNLANAIEVRLGNGLQIIERTDNIEHIVIAGMGGALIKSILEEGKNKLNNITKIIAQPNVDARNVRKWFDDNGFSIIEESILEENGHIYEVVVAIRNTEYKESLTEKELFFGPKLINNKSSVFLKKWEQEYGKLKKVVQQMKKASVINNKKIMQFEEELSWIEEVLTE